MEPANKKKNIALVIIMVVAITGTIFFISKNKNSIEVSDNFDDIFDSGVTIPEQIEVDIFSSETFSTLEDYSDKDLDLEPRGKTNPFKPFKIIEELDPEPEPGLEP